VLEPNISAWRRQVCGDLTSAFDFTSPDTSYPLLPAPTPVTCVSNVTPTPPSPQVIPVPESGTNLSRPRPYRSNAFSFADCPNHRLGITITNAGTASAHFAIYANAFRTDGPWQYDVPASGSVTDYFSVSAGGRYDLTCYGPHWFHLRFAGSLNTNCNLLNVVASLNPDGSSFLLALQNATPAPVTFTITNTAAPGPALSYTVPPGYQVTNTLSGAVDSAGSYSFAAVASTDPTFLRQFSGGTDTAGLQLGTNAPPVSTNTPPVTNNPPPVISVPAISLSGGSVTLTYPAWAAAYSLESATNLYSGAWTAINPAAVTNGDDVTVTVPATASPLYFRLRP